MQTGTSLSRFLILSDLVADATFSVGGENSTDGFSSYFLSLSFINFFLPALGVCFSSSSLSVCLSVHSMCVHVYALYVTGQLRSPRS